MAKVATSSTASDLHAASAALQVLQDLTAAPVLPWLPHHDAPDQLAQLLLILADDRQLSRWGSPRTPAPGASSPSALGPQVHSGTAA